MRFPGRYQVVPLGVDLDLFRPAAKRKVVVLEWRQAERPLLRAIVRELVAAPDWELVLLRTKPLGGRPTLSRLLRGRVRVRTARDGESRAERAPATRPSSCPPSMVSRGSSSRRRRPARRSRRRRDGGSSRSSPPRRPAG